MNGTPIFSCTVGSFLYGIQTPKSDQDILTIVYEPIETIFGFKRFESRQTIRTHMSGKVTDETIFTIKTFLKLLVGGNPNAMQVFSVSDFYAPHILIRHPGWDSVREFYPHLINMDRVLNAYRGIIYSELEMVAKQPARAGKHTSNILRYMRDLRDIYETGYCSYPLSETDRELHNEIRSGRKVIGDLKELVDSFFDLEDFTTDPYFNSSYDHCLEYANRLLILLYKDFYGIN